MTGRTTTLELPIETTSRAFYDAELGGWIAVVFIPGVGPLGDQAEHDELCEKITAEVARHWGPESISPFGARS